MEKLMIKPNVLKKSYYNFFIPKEDGTYLVYNSLSGAIIYIYSEINVRKLREIMEKDTIIYDNSDEMILTFYEKGILVPKDRREYEFARYCYERDVVRDTTLVLTLIVTRQCNLRCIYCYEEHENKAMTEDLYSSILKYIDNSLRNKLYTGVAISLFGGEPFVEYDKVVAFLGKVKSLCEEYGIPYSASATTNGALIYPERFEVLSSLNCRYYQITVDGFKETHDKYRASVDGRGSWDKIMENLKYMASTDYNFKVTIRTNFNDEVFLRAEEFYKYIKENFDNRFSIYYEGIKRLGGCNDDKLDILDKLDVAKSSVNIAKVIKQLNINNDVVDVMTRPYSRVCYASKHNNLIIDYDGSILKCTLSLDDDLNKIGYISEDGSMNLAEDKHSRWVSNKVDLQDECKECRVLPICFGGRCVNGRVHGEKYFCDPKIEESELENLISTYR